MRSKNRKIDLQKRTVLMFLLWPKN